MTNLIGIMTLIHNWNKAQHGKISNGFIDKAFEFRGFKP